MLERPKWMQLKCRGQFRLPFVNRAMNKLKMDADSDFNSIMFEKRLTGLKDSQESINACCHWCLNNRQHHKKIVSCWLNVLKRVKIEHRLTLFYLANDVIQYSKRRNYDFVESWGTTLQKATTMVRDEKVKHKILRIFKIWEQRGIYGEEFLTDLCGLISASPSARKGDETHEFQSAYLIQKIKTCSKLETDTDLKLKALKEHNPKIQIDSESLISSLKDRAHVDDVEKEVDEYTNQMDNYINALKMEIKARINLISLLTQAETQLENDKKDVKLVTTAYKTFATRVKALKKKLDEKIPALASPVPSPDINAPSPSPDSDIELPGTESNNNHNTASLPSTLYTNPGYYNPVPPPQEASSRQSNVGNNNFSSFMGSMPFNLSNLSTTNLFGSTPGENTTANTSSQPPTSDSANVNDAITSLFPSITCPPPPPATTASSQSTDSYQYTNSGHVPLMPPPMPPFSKDDNYGGGSYGETYNGNSNSNNYVNRSYESSGSSYQSSADPYTPHQHQPPTTTPYQPSTTSPYDSSTQSYPTPPEPFTSSYIPAPPFQNPEPPNYSNPAPPMPAPFADEYNPEEELDTWENEATWEPPPAVELDTPESPPTFEKEGYSDPVEYHDTGMFEGGQDVDHRVLPPPMTANSKPELKSIHRAKDVDHRNLISLTGSPSDNRPPPWISQSDQDYRKPPPNKGDQDYRVPFNIENFKLPPPPPPPNMLDASSFKMDEKTPKRPGNSPRKVQDNIESIDMDLSDDEAQQEQLMDDIDNENFELPPPFPEFFNDADANKFLDNVDESIDDFDAGALEVDHSQMKAGLLGHAPPFPNFGNPPPMPEWNNQEFEYQDFEYQEFEYQEMPPNTNFNFRGRGNRGNFRPSRRGAWNRGNGEFRGRGRGAPWPPRGGFRGNFYNKRGRGWERGRGEPRGRVGFRGNFRGGF